MRTPTQVGRDPPQPRRVRLRARSLAAPRRPSSLLSLSQPSRSLAWPRLVEEALWRLEDLASVPHRTSQDPPQHVAAPFRRRLGAVRDRKRQRADVVRHDAVRHVDTVRILLTNLAAVRAQPRRNLLDRLE
eukprot:6203228-Pleurochrysis_carterae.AAC.2